MFIGYQLVMMVSLSAALLRQAVYGSIRLGAYQNIADNYTRSSMLHCCNSTPVQSHPSLILASVYIVSPVYSIQ